MNSKIVCGFIFAFFSILELGYAIKCYSCNSEASCKNAPMYECNQRSANETSQYLSGYFNNVNTNLTSSNYNCMRQRINFSSSSVTYKGCVYSNLNSCSLTIKPTAFSTVTCYQCNNFDGCNPADRKSVSTLAIALPLAFFVIYKYFV